MTTDGFPENQNFSYTTYDTDTDDAQTDHFCSNDEVDYSSSTTTNDLDTKIDI